MTNYFSFIPYPYKLVLIRTLVDRAYTINNAWLGFHENIKKLTEILKNNLFPAHLVERVVNRKKFLSAGSFLTLTRDECTLPVSVSDTTINFYFKLPYICPFSVITQKRVRQFAKCYCNNIDVKLAFSSFKIGDMFGVKDPIPRGLRTCVVYKFLCASCNACYVGETPRHLSTRVREHLISNGTSHIFRYLHNSPQCRTLCSDECCNTLDHAATTFQLKIKEKTITK